MISRQSTGITQQMKRLVHLTLLTLLLGLQAKLWFGQGGLRELWLLRGTVAEQAQRNEVLVARNDALVAEVRDLKIGTEALEERARNEFGLMQPEESFYQVVQHNLR